MNESIYQLNLVCHNNVVSLFPSIDKWCQNQKGNLCSTKALLVTNQGQRGGAFYWLHETILWVSHLFQIS